MPSFPMKKTSSNLFGVFQSLAIFPYKRKPNNMFVSLGLYKTEKATVSPFASVCQKQSNRTTDGLRSKYLKAGETKWKKK